MRVGLIGPAPPLRGGISAHTAGLHDALVVAGHDVHVVSYARLYPQLIFPGSSERSDGVGRLGVDVLDTLDPASWRRGGRLLAGLACDAIVVEWWNPVVAPAVVACLSAQGRGTPRIFVCHNARPHESFPGWSLLTRWALGRADSLICHSQAVRRELGRTVRALPAEVCPMPMLIDVGSPPGERAEARRRLGLPARGPIALFLGHVRAYKGIDHLLAAWERASLPADASLVIAGESYLGRRRLAAAVSRLARRRSIRLIERFLTDDEIRDLLAAADVLVAPYSAASQSGTVPLALAAGLTVVASDAGGLAEPLAGRPGHHVYRAGDDGGLAGALAGALSLAGDARGRGTSGDAALRQSPGAATSTARQASWAPLVAACERLARRVPARGAAR